MHGIVNRAIQSYVTRTRGADVWDRVVDASGVADDVFIALEVYDEAMTLSLLDAAAAEIGQPRDMLIEDIGTFVVSHPEVTSIRRLLRYGGADFTAFLQSLEGLADRVSLALSSLVLPKIIVTQEAADVFRLTFHGGPTGSAHFFLGVLRAMADEYGVLALLSHEVTAEGAALIVQIADARHGEARGFVLGAVG